MTQNSQNSPGQLELDANWGRVYHCGQTVIEVMGAVHAIQVSKCRDASIFLVFACAWGS